MVKKVLAVIAGLVFAFTATVGFAQAPATSGEEPVKKEEKVKPVKKAVKKKVKKAKKAKKAEKAENATEKKE